MADPFFTDDVLETIVHDAATTLAAIGEAQQVAVLIAWLKRPEEIAPTASGWCEVGRLAHASGRFWWSIHWHPEEARGRLLRRQRPPETDGLGAVLPRDEAAARTRQRRRSPS
jgi:hypothetical protein